jgi:regulator of sirC expression with transglutaminase-like and TPR domain
MQAPEGIRADFVRLLSRPNADFDLVHAALLVAAESHPDLDVQSELRRIDTWAEELRQHVDPSFNNLQKLARLRNFAFEQLGFRGDANDYYSPSNSLLHEVMSRRRGIPLTLSILFLELGWRIGMPVEGVGFPGHFLVRLSGEEEDVILDPYRRGMIVHEEDQRRMLREFSGGRLEYDHGMVASVTKRDMIVRLLRNLKAAYLREADDANALLAVERLLVLFPDDPEEIRDRGLLRYRLHRYGAALADLGEYLRLRPEAADHAQIEAHAVTLRQIVAAMN